MADQPTQQAPKTPAAPSVRGFLNLSAPLPTYGAVTQAERDLGIKDGARGLLFGVGNIVPVIAMAAKQASPTAYRCIERRTQFLVGTGFPVPKRDPETGRLLDETQAGTLGETPVPGHPGKTANDLWAELCSYGGDFNGAAVLVRYSNGSTIGEIHVLPFGAVRKTVKGTYLFNHRFGRKGYKQSETTEHLPFDSNKKVVLALLRKAQQEDRSGKPNGQPGQIFFIYTPKAGEEDYPLPPHWPGLEALLKEAAYDNYDLNEVRRGFIAKGILTLLGELDDTIKDENGLTELDRQNELLRTYTVEGALEQGVERESILVMAAKSKDAAAIWTPINTTTDLKWLSEKIDSVGREICRHVGIPPELVGFAKPGQLGNNQELLNIIAYTQATLEPTRQMLLRAFWRLMPSLNGLVPGKLTPVQVAATIQPAPTPAQP